MKTQIFKTTLIVLMVSLFGQFQVNGAGNINPNFGNPEFYVKNAESSVSKCKKEVLKQEKAILRWEDQVDQGEKRLAKANGPISPLDRGGRPKSKIDWEIAATQKRIDIGSARSNLDSTKRRLRSSKERLRIDQRSLSNAEMELTKARARLAARKMKENEGSPATNNQSPLTQVPQTAQANPQAPLNAPKLPFPFSSYDVWIKTGKILPGMTGLLHGENADGTFTDDRLSTIRDREAGRAYGYLTMPQNRSWILRWVARRPNGKKLAWTFGGNQRNLLQWKGQSARNVLNVFGKADRIVDEREKGVNGFQTTADWDYNVMNIRDSINGLHTRVRFKMNNGVVQEIRLLD